MSFEPIDRGLFESRTRLKLCGRTELWNDVSSIVSLRSLVEVLCVEIMSRSYLEQIIRSVSLVQDSQALVYKNATIRLVRSDPHHLSVGQTFVEERKCMSLLSEFTNVFHDFCVARGTAKCGPLIVLGRTGEGEIVVAHYLPPIVEVHDADHALLDGLHRSYLQKNVGTTGESILISGAAYPFPCGLRRWEEVRLVQEKPPKTERFFNLVPALFRDVKSIGIDG